MREGTLKQLNVKVGDKVRPLVNPRGETIQGGKLMLITYVDFNYGWCMGRNVNKPWQEDIRLSDQIIFRLEEEAMEEIKIGDEVVYDDGLDNILCKVLAEGNYWVVINYQGGRPWVVNKADVSKPKPKPVVEEVVMVGGPIAKTWGFDSLCPISKEDTHKITFNVVDGEPDCNSIKMVKL